MSSQAATAVPGPSGQRHPFKLKRKLIKVIVRSDFVFRATPDDADDGDGAAVFHWKPGEPVSHATVQLSGSAITVLADSSGTAKLDVTGVADGDYQITITKASPLGSMSSDAMGPTIAFGLASPPQRIYRPIAIAVSIQDGLLTKVRDPYDPASGSTDAQIGNRTQDSWTPELLPVDWRPIWIRSDKRKARDVDTKIDLIIIHETGGEPIGPCINEAINNKGPHYEIDKDGHTVKFVQDSQIAYHAGISRWGSQTFVKGDKKYVNPNSIGIEVVNKTGPVTDLQYAALLKLLNTLISEFSIPTYRIVGHSDIATGHDDTLLDDRRATCPGADFCWDRLEKDGLGMIPQTVDLGGYYGGYFSTYTDAWKLNDDDDSQKYGGKVRKDIPQSVPNPTDPPVGVPTDLAVPAAAPILELQNDLKHIGYSVFPTGKYDSHTQMAVNRFQRHFYSGGRKSQLPKGAALGQLDASTAALIKCVRAGIP